MLSDDGNDYDDAFAGVPYTMSPSQSVMPDHLALRVSGLTMIQNEVSPLTKALIILHINCKGEILFFATQLENGMCMYLIFNPTKFTLSMNQGPIS